MEDPCSEEKGSSLPKEIRKKLEIQVGEPLLLEEKGDH
jgi:bifunctional DNA-binding transcriptional regulator/antitoxin component of YhaV-PrlF toxin-antitoxin module